MERLEKYNHLWTAQHWHRCELLSEITGLRYDTAREIGRAYASVIGTSRLIAEGADYCEVYQHNGEARYGTFASTTLVHVEGE